MFTITTEQKQYLTTTLSDGLAGSQIEVVPERGGIITHWRIQGKELLYLDTERFTHPELTVRGGIPILFPICGNLPDDSYTVKGKPYTLKQHGFARNLPWQVVDQQTGGRASITLALSSTDQTLANYPFAFHLSFTYILLGSTLTIQQRYTNNAQDPMPFSSGFHPYFLAPDKTQLHFDFPSTQFTDRAGRVTPFTGQFDWGQPEIDVTFQNLSRTSATVTDPTQGTRLTLSYDSHYAALVFWTPQGKNFYCLEPWTGPRNALNTGEHLLTVEPGSTLETNVSFTVTPTVSS